MMQRKPGFPVANCSIKMPDGMPLTDVPPEDDGEQVQRRQQLINFGHSQWGFNNWSWSVTKQELDFVDFSNGKYCAGVCAYVSVTVKSFDIHRENIGYATTLAPQKGAAIFRSRKCAVTNGLRETLLSFGGSVATELLELLETNKTEQPAPAPLPPEQPENNQNLANKPAEPKNSPINKNIRKDSAEGMKMAPVVKNVVPAPPIAKAHPMPANIPANRPQMLPANAPRPPQPTAPHPRPNPNEGRIEGMSEEEARAERKRRQQRAQEEFRQKMLQQNQGHSHDDKQEAQRTLSVDSLLMEIPTQDIEIEHTGDDSGKRKSPPHDATAKRRTLMTKLDIFTD